MPNDKTKTATLTPWPKELLTEIAKEAHPKSKHPHYGVKEARVVLNAVRALGGRVVFPAKMAESEINEHIHWVQRHVG